MQAGGLSAAEAERLREFERQGHDRLALTYHEFFSPVTALAIEPLLDAVMVSPGVRLLDVACGPGALTAAAATPHSATAKQSAHFHRPWCAIYATARYCYLRPPFRHVCTPSRGPALRPACPVIVDCRQDGVSDPQRMFLRSINSLAL
jgi:hypothetical protein